MFNPRGRNWARNTPAQAELPPHHAKSARDGDPGFHPITRKARMMGTPAWTRHPYRVGTDAKAEPPVLLRMPFPAAASAGWAMRPQSGRRWCASCPTRRSGNSNRSNSARPACVHSFHRLRTPWLSASACSWFLMRVRATTCWCRSTSNCRTSRSSRLGTQIFGKRPSISNCNRCSASRRSVFCLSLTTLALARRGQHFTDDSTEGQRHSRSAQPFQGLE